MEDKDKYNKTKRKIWQFVGSALAGTIAGFGCTVTGHPLDTVKVRM
jgi:hypothetical protein